MQYIRCDRCKAENELKTAASKGFREFYGTENFHIELCKNCVSDLYSFIFNQPTKPRVKEEGGKK